MESIKDVLLTFGLLFIASVIVDTFNLTWWVFWLISITIIVAYTYVAIFLAEGGYQEYRETRQARKIKKNEKERELKRREYEIEQVRKRKEYEKEQRRLTKHQRSILKNPNVYQETEDINSTKNDCPNCGRSDGRHDPKCYI